MVSRPPFLRLSILLPEGDELVWATLKSAQCAVLLRAVRPGRGVRGRSAPRGCGVSPRAAGATMGHAAGSDVGKHVTSFAVEPSSTSTPSSLGCGTQPKREEGVQGGEHPLLGFGAKPHAATGTVQRTGPGAALLTLKKNAVSDTARVLG